MSQLSGPNVEQLRGPRLQKHQPDYGRSPPQPALAPANGESARAPAWSELRQARQSARPAAPLSPGAGYTWLPQLTGVVRRTARLRPSALREASHPGSAILPALDIPSQPHPEIATKSVPRDREEVGNDIQVIAEGEILVDCLDSQTRCCLWSLNLDGLPVHHNFARIGGSHARDYLDQR